MDAPLGMAPNGVPVVRVTGSPYERGLQRGRLIPDRIASRVERLLSAYGRIAPRSDLLWLAEREEAILKNALPEVVDELSGIAKGSGIAVDDLRIAALVRTSGFQAAMSAQPGQADDCLCFAVAGSATVDGTPLVGKNGDLVTSVSGPDDILALYVVPDDGHAHITVGVYPEKPTQPDGINAAGLVVVGAGQYPSDGREAFERGDEPGVCIYHLLARIYATCSSVEEGLEALRREPRGYTGRVMILADATGAWAKVEVSRTKMQVRYREASDDFPATDVAAGTSGVFDFADMQALITSREDRPAAYERYDRVMRFLDENAGGFDRALAQSLLSSHVGGRGLSSPCKHVDGVRADALPALENLPTLQSCLFEPADRRVWIAKGPPCTTTFEPIAIEAAHQPRPLAAPPRRLRVQCDKGANATEQQRGHEQ